MPYVRSFDGTRIFYVAKRGIGRTLVFVHGWPHSHSAWASVASFFEKRGYGSLSIDLRGFGRSGKPRGGDSYRMELFARDVYCVLKSVGVRKPVIVGHSFGGMVALKFAELYPGFASGLVLVDTTYENPLRALGLLRLTPFLKNLLDIVVSHEGVVSSRLRTSDFSRFRGNSEVYHWLQGAKHASVPVVALCLREMLDFDVGLVLGKISLPVLIIVGDSDFATPTSSSKEMHLMIKGSRLVVVKNAYHNLNLTNPGDLQREILEFVELLKK
ncbi:alpha/beta hydrolase [Candidatus Woesearchaeota archaeon]|nr:alpha/beta hydrolase [Candidatus Woesearchaeota archaeon]